MKRVFVFVAVLLFALAMFGCSSYTNGGQAESPSQSACRGVDDAISLGEDFMPMHEDIAYVYVDFFFATEDLAIEYETTLVRGTPGDVFAKWADLNSVQGVGLIDFLIECSSITIDDDMTARRVLGNHFVLNLILSQEFDAYKRGDNGKLLLEALESTFFSYIPFDELNLILLPGNLDGTLGVDIIIKTVGPTGISFSLQNMTDNEYLYGSHYSLYMFRDNSWRPVKPIIENFAFTDEGFPLFPQSTTDVIHTNWVWLYGHLPAGVYKIQTPIWYVRSPGDFDKYILDAVFEILAD